MSILYSKMIVAADNISDIAEPDKHDERRSSAWDIQNAPRNYAALAFYQFASAFLSFAAVWLITHWMGSKGYGAVVAVIAASQVAQIFVNWTSVAVVRYGVDEFIEKATISRIFWTRAAILLINVVGVLAISSVWFPPLADYLRLQPAAFWVVVCHFVVTAFWLHMQMSMQAVKMLRTQGLLQMIERLLIFAGVLCLVLSGKLTVYSAVICYIAAPLAMLSTSAFLIRRFVFARFSVDSAFLKKILVYSLPLLPYFLVGFLSGSYVDAVFVSKFLSTRELGIYSIATQISGIAMQLPTLANSIILPLLVTLQSETSDERSYKYFRNVLPGAVLLWGLGCTVASLVGYYLIPMLFKPEFAPAGVPLWVLLSASVMAIPVALGYSALANARSATYIPMTATILSAGINIAGDIFLIPRLGMVGCAAASLIAYAASLVIFGTLLNKTAKMPLSWTMTATLPSLAGVGILLLTDEPFAALGACVAATLVLAFTRQASLLEMYGFISGFWRTASGD